MNSFTEYLTEGRGITPKQMEKKIRKFYELLLKTADELEKLENEIIEGGKGDKWRDAAGLHISGDLPGRIISQLREAHKDRNLKRNIEKINWYIK